MGSVRDGNTARPLPYHEPELPSAETEPFSAVQPNPSPRWDQLDRRDWLVSALLILSVGTGCLFIADSMPDYLLQSMDFWFEADTIREVSNMTSRTDDHSRTSVHPLFSILTFIPVYIVKQALAIPPLRAVLYVTSFLGGLWGGTLYLLLRSLGSPKFDATIFTLLGLSSASAMFWLPVPNSYTIGSWSIMLVLILLLSAEQRRIGASTYVIASAFTLSITVTNWMAGLLTTVARWPLKQAIQLSINAFCLVVILWGAQKFFFPSAEFFLGSRKEAAWIHHPQSGSVQNIASSFAFHTLIAPALQFIDDDGYIQFGNDSFRLSQRLAFQFSAPGSAGLLGLFAVGLWSALLLNGLWRLVTLDRHLRFRLVLATLLLFELSLHLFYGEETFTYSLNFSPLLIALAALGTLGPGRPVVLTLAGLLAVCAAMNNWQQFQQAVESAVHFTPQRDEMTSMMRKDPNRPWPRSVGHIPLAIPGSSEAEHAYHEPGGDFSPQAPSFGISLWLCDAEGHPVVTSQTLPLRDIQQTFAPSSHPSIPAIHTRTPYYDASWSRLDATRWELRIKNRSSYIPAILIRSVGPAGGPVRELTWNGEEVSVNHRWTIAVSPAPSTVSLGDESKADWATPQAVKSWSGKSGWGYARLVLSAKTRSEDQEYRLVVTDLRVPIQMQRWYRNPPERAKATLPDARFQASMDAQVNHLRMGLIGGETRPGDPALFLRAWQRQAAYITAALARAGDPNVSWVLSKFLSTHDFAGGAGSEADAPGLTIWALTESASYIANPDHDRWLWPHIVRKTQLIETMLTAEHSIEQPFVVPSPYDLQHGQQVKISLLAQPAREGLIVGRVGNDWPSLYVNAVSYRGLIAAAEFASRLGRKRDATRWRNQAHALSARWPHGPFNSPLQTIATAMSSRPSLDLLKRGHPLEQPLVTYSPAPDDQRPATTMIHAHQLLRSGRPDDLWMVLERFWNRQASPGLYTWDTGRPPTADIADGWQYMRGWHNPMVISPDYETAALLLLLQQDMLAYVDREVESPTLVIGAGIPKTWLAEPLAVSGLAIPGGSIDWRWDGQSMFVSLHGLPQNVRLGTAFPKRTKIVLTSHPTAA
jgi:hypothetical protein